MSLTIGVRTAPTLTQRVLHVRARDLQRRCDPEQYARQHGDRRGERQDPAIDRDRDAREVERARTHDGAQAPVSQHDADDAAAHRQDQALGEQLPQ